MSDMNIDLPALSARQAGGRQVEKPLDGVVVEWKPLGEVGVFVRGNGLQKSDFVESGVGCIHYGQIYTFYGNFAYQTKSFVSPVLATKLRKAQKGDLIIATTSENIEDVCKALVWLGEDEVCVSGETYIFKHNQNPKYLAYYLQTPIFFDFNKRNQTGTKVIRVHGDKLAEFTIPIPCPDKPEKSLEIQAEIVRILDAFTELTAELTAELTVRKKQYNHYRDQLLSFDLPAGRQEGEVEWRALGNIGEVRMCKRILKSQTSSEGEIPFYKIGTFGKESDAYIPRSLFEEYKSKYNYPKIGEILISASGTIGQTVVFNGEDAYFQDSNIVWIENDERVVLNKFLFYFYKIANWGISEGGTIQRLYNDNLRKLLIPIPYPNDPDKSLAEQASIIAILDKFDTLTNSISEGLPCEIALRQKQYEYYRDLLLSFPKPVPETPLE